VLPISDGAAAVVVCSEAPAPPRRRIRRAVKVLLLALMRIVCLTIAKAALAIGLAGL
jgi:hypothetical protein